MGKVSSTENSGILDRYDDDWLKDDGRAALVMDEYLMPVEGKDAPVFPAIFAASEGGEFGAVTTSTVLTPAATGVSGTYA